MLSYSEIFLILFITLGPIKLLLPFVHLTTNADRALQRNLAWRSFSLPTIILFVVALFGAGLVEKWRITPPALMLAAAIILFIWSVQLLGQIGKAAPAPPPERPTLALAVIPLTVPSIITPYGIAAVMLFSMAPFAQTGRGMIILLLLILAVMVLNLLFMLGSRRLLKAIGGPLTMQLAGAVLGVLQAALAVQIALNALVRLGMPGTIG